MALNFAPDPHFLSQGFFQGFLQHVFSQFAVLEETEDQSSQVSLPSSFSSSFTLNLSA